MCEEYLCPPFLFGKWCGPRNTNSIPISSTAEQVIKLRQSELSTSWPRYGSEMSMCLTLQSEQILQPLPGMLNRRHSLLLDINKKEEEFPPAGCLRSHRGASLRMKLILKEAEQREEMRVLVKLLKCWIKLHLTPLKFSVKWTSKFPPLFKLWVGLSVTWNKQQLKSQYVYLQNVLWREAIVSGKTSKGSVTPGEKKKQKTRFKIFKLGKSLKFLVTLAFCNHIHLWSSKLFIW